MATVRYTVINGHIIAEKRDGVRQFYSSDALGSTVALYSGSNQDRRLQLLAVRGCADPHRQYAHKVEMRRHPLMQRTGGRRHLHAGQSRGP